VVAGSDEEWRWRLGLAVRGGATQRAGGVAAGGPPGSSQRGSAPGTPPLPSLDLADRKASTTLAYRIADVGTGLFPVPSSSMMGVADRLQVLVETALNLFSSEFGGIEIYLTN
jgi:hypothetical protein